MAASALQMFRRLGATAPGRWLFSRLVCWRAPYFSSIRPTVEALTPGRCVVKLRDRRRVHNHIGTVHAIALCNAAELAGGLATDATLPPALRWIPKGMNVRYLRKAVGTMIATAQVPMISTGTSGADVIAHVDVRDAQGDIVFDADITMWIAPRKA
jgi:acyl-coenzyme A thioesterase PaaI-like protein